MMKERRNRPVPKNRRGVRWSEEEKAEALDLLREGYSYYAVAKMTGLSDSHLAIKFPGYGRKPNGAPEDYVQFHIPEDKLPVVEQLLDDGHSLVDVSRETGVSINHMYANYPQFAYTRSEIAAVAHWKRRHLQDS